MLKEKRAERNLCFFQLVALWYNNRFAVVISGSRRKKHTVSLCSLLYGNMKCKRYRLTEEKPGRGGGDCRARFMKKII